MAAVVTATAAVNDVFVKDVVILIVAVATVGGKSYILRLRRGFNLALLFSSLFYHLGFFLFNFF